MRGECNILVKINGELEQCCKPSVYSEPCGCDKCDADPGYHLPTQYCAEHYDGLVSRSREWYMSAAIRSPGF
jgi:hypothetical protein